MGNLPPLPEPIWGYSTNTPKFSADQMHAYARAALQALEDEAEASIKEMIDKGLGQVQPVAWQAIGGSIWNHKTSEDDRPLYAAPQPAPVQSRQPVSVEPVAIALHTGTKHGLLTFNTTSKEYAQGRDAKDALREALAKPPAQARQPLTEDQIKTLFKAWHFDYHATAVDLIRSVERACAEAWGVKLCSITPTGEGAA